MKYATTNKFKYTHVFLFYAVFFVIYFYCINSILEDITLTF